MLKCLKQGFKNTLKILEHTEYGGREVEKRGREKWDVLSFYLLPELSSLNYPRDSLNYFKSTANVDPAMWDISST